MDDDRAILVSWKTLCAFFVVSYKFKNAASLGRVIYYLAERFVLQITFLQPFGNTPKINWSNITALQNFIIILEGIHFK